MTLSEIRKKRGLTLRHLSKLSGVGVSTIGNFENGRTTLSKPFLKKIADVLQVSPDSISEPIGQLYGALEQARSEGGWRMEMQIIEEIRARVEQFPFANTRTRKLYTEQIIHRLREYGDWCEGRYTELRQEVIDHAQEKNPAKILDSTADGGGAA